MDTSSQATKEQFQRCPVCDTEVTADPSTQAADVQCSHCGHLVWFRLQKNDDAVIVNVLPRMNPERTNMQRVGEMLVRSRSAPRIIVDLSLAERISSTFLNELLRLLKIVQAADGRLILCGVQPLFRDIFKITSLQGLFEFSENQQTALERLG